MKEPISSNLRCLRDPDFKKHEWHAGHISRIEGPSPMQAYEDRKRRKMVGHRAFSIIRDMEHYHGMQLTDIQKHMLYIFIRDELYLGSN
jgi:hypothetical protein